MSRHYRSTLCLHLEYNEVHSINPDGGCQRCASEKYKRHPFLLNCAPVSELAVWIVPRRQSQSECTLNVSGPDDTRIVAVEADVVCREHCAAHDRIACGRSSYWQESSIRERVVHVKTLSAFGVARMCRALLGEGASVFEHFHSGVHIN